MDLRHVSKTESCYKFFLKEHIKQPKPGKRNPELVLPAFPADKRLCVITCLDAYIAKTETVRNTQNTRLFLSYTKPYHPVTKNTLSRWVKYVMEKSRIDINMLRSHSTRSASTSAALRSGVPIDIIMKVAGWSTKCTFARFYNKKFKPGVAPGIFQRGADSSDKGAKIWFSGYYECQKSPKKLCFTFRRGLACSDGRL